MRFKISITVLLLLLVIALKAQVPEFTQHISRSFRVTGNMTVDIVNKYGKVQIIHWDNDSVKFNIDMRIRAKDNQKLEKIKQSVEFEFTPGQYYVLARTTFGDSGSDVIKDLVDIAGSYLSSSNSVSINYTVMVPRSVSLRIENKFGDVYFDDLQGSLNLTLSYGNLKANRLDGRSEIRLTSGDGEIGYFKEGQISLSYGDLYIGETGKLIAVTRSSNVSIDKAENLKLDSRRDKIYLDDAKALSGTSYFSSINLTSLENDLTFSSRYGSITVNNIQRSFALINLASEFTDLALAFERPMSFSFELTHHQDVLFVYPKSMASLNTKVFDAENKIFRTSGTFGAGTSDSEVVLKAARKCSVTISQK